MAAGKSSRINRQDKTKYRIRNWREYERGLRSRGDVTIWLSEDAIAAWIPPKNGLRGGQRRYSNLAIRTALTLRVVFGLPLRQTEGFLDSLLSLMSRDLKAPDHTTLSRRNQIVVGPPLTRAHDGPIDLSGSRRMERAHPHSLIFSPRSKFPSGVSRRTGPTTPDRSTIGPARPVQRTS